MKKKKPSTPYSHCTKGEICLMVGERPNHWQLSSYKTAICISAHHVLFGRGCGGRIWGHGIVESQRYLDIIIISLYAIFSCQRRRDYNFHVPLFTLPESGVPIPTALDFTIYTINIFSRVHMSLPVFHVLSAEYQGMGSCGGSQESLEDEDLNYCHRCHTKTAHWCFSSLCVYENVTTYKDEMMRPLLIPPLATACIIFQITAIWLLDDSKDDLRAFILRRSCMII